jgi:hypothetical protein
MNKFTSKKAMFLAKFEQIEFNDISQCIKMSMMKWKLSLVQGLVNSHKSIKYNWSY